jgi:Na+/proline symporter
MFIFAWFSNVCNEKIPNGYTLSAFIKEKYGNYNATIYQVVLSLISLGFISLTFTALNKFLIFLEFPNLEIMTGLVVLGTLIYALKGGLKTNLVTGSVQMVFMILFCSLLLIAGLSGEGLNHLVAGLNGKAGYDSIFDPKLLMSFGIVMALTSVTGIVGNQSYYQKSFGQQNTGHSAKSFILGGLFFAFVPLTLGILGIMAYGAGMDVKDPSTAHLMWMQTNLGLLAVLGFGFIVLNASANALDASGNAFGAIVAHDWVKDESKSIFWSRVAIIGIASVGWAISILNLSITYIFLTYGVLRVTLFVITLLAVRTEWLSKTGMFLSVASIAPIAAYMNLNNMKLEAALIGFFVAPLLALMLSRFFPNRV